MIGRFICWLFDHKPDTNVHFTQRMVIKTTRCTRCHRLLDVEGDGRVGRAARRRAMRRWRAAT